MTLYENYIVFPDGEQREISHSIRMDDLVDLNGFPLDIPIATNRMLAYHVAQKRTREDRGIITTLYYLEQLNANELLEYT